MVVNITFYLLVVSAYSDYINGQSILLYEDEKCVLLIRPRALYNNNKLKK